MSIAALMYHDVTPRGREDTSGFAGGDAARYKLTPERFDAHLRRLAGSGATPVTIDAAAALNGSAGPSCLLTFDDGGASAATRIADSLERRGWRGHFFVTTAYLNRPAFLTAADLRSLRRRGHVIGSHSHSHPLRMSACSAARLADEWRHSIAILSDVLGEAIATASVPGGASSQLVERTAADAGVRYLFTSEPTHRTRRTAGMLVVGRYAMFAQTSAAAAAAIVGGSWTVRLASVAEWQVKQAFKVMAGAWYLRGRKRLLRGSDRVRWGDEIPAISEDST